MKLTGRSAVCLALLLLLPLFSFAAKAKTSAANEKFRLIHSDKLFLTTVNEENLLELFGNVHFFYGKTEFYSNRATIFDQQKIARLIGTVRVSNDTINVTADSISYYRLADKLNMGGHIIITEKESKGLFNRFTCDFGTYDKANDIITATQNVSGFSQSEKARAKSNYAYWDRKNGYGYLMEKPELWSEDRDTLYIRSEKMEFFDADHKVIATFDVLAQSREYKATSDFLLYFMKEDKAIFQGEPAFDSDFAKATAKEFYLYFKARKLFKAELKDSCLVYFANEKNQPKTNWVRAKYILMNLDNDYLQDFQAEENITYFYLQEQEVDKDFFSNDASGQFLSATFLEDGKLDTMRMKNNVRGIYRFETIPD
jgi:lipopolysaccharide export system protein LptA